MSKAHWLALASISGFGGVTVRKLLDEFGDVESIFAASPQELIAIPRVSEAMAEQVRTAPLEKLEEELYALSDADVQLLTWDDSRFPSSLSDLKDPPIVLFMHGSLKRADSSAAAIVGTRAPVETSTKFAGRLASELAARGITIVSGLALGIDTAAHQGALAAEEGRTLAVLGSGILAIHPRENAELAEQIAARGAVLSELMPNAPPRGPQLMARDRLVSGLSRVVMVIEASAKSGSLDTAERARKQGRLVMALPGSPGTEGLLRGGATRLDDETIDFDALAEMIHTHTLTPEGKPPQQGKLL